jgi:hypothetical protein
MTAGLTSSAYSRAIKRAGLSRVALTNQSDCLSYLTVTAPNSLTTPPHGEKPPVFELP